MKKRKGSLLQRMMAVLFSAVLATGMVSNAAPMTVLAQESIGGNAAEESGTQDSVSGNEAATVEDGVTPEEGTESAEKKTDSGNPTGAETEDTGETVAEPANVMMMAEPAEDSGSLSGDGWTLGTDGKLTISSDTGMGDWKENGWSENESKVTSLEIAGSVTNIPKGAFQRCQFTDVVIPEGVTTIGNAAFAYCDKMTAIRIPDTVTTIERGAFEDCTSLKTVRIPDCVETIEDSTFGSCEALESVALPKNLKKIGDFAFSILLFSKGDGTAGRTADDRQRCI